MQLSSLDSSHIKGNIQLSSITMSYTHPPSQLVPKSQIKRYGCPPACACEACIQLGYTKMLLLDDEQTILYQGPIMIRLPVSNLYKMNGLVTLTYKTFYRHALGDVVKLKYTYVDAIPGLFKIFVTIKPKEFKEQISVNAEDSVYWFINIVRTKMYINHKVGIPLKKYQDKVLGNLYFKQGGSWKKKGVQITDRLRIQGEDAVRKIKEFWTRFELIDVEGLCLVVKFWDFLTKIEIGIPLSSLSIWLWAFLSLVHD